MADENVKVSMTEKQKVKEITDKIHGGAVRSGLCFDVAADQGIDEAGAGAEDRAWRSSGSQMEHGQYLHPDGSGVAMRKRNLSMIAGGFWYYETKRPQVCMCFHRGLREMLIKYYRKTEKCQGSNVLLFENLGGGNGKNNIENF